MADSSPFTVMTSIFATDFHEFKHLGKIPLSPVEDLTQGCARFLEFVQNLSECQILCSLCSIVFYALTLKLPLQTSLSVAPKLPVSLSSNEECPNCRKTNTPQYELPFVLYHYKHIVKIGDTFFTHLNKCG